MIISKALLKWKVFPYIRHTQSVRAWHLNDIPIKSLSPKRIGRILFQSHIISAQTFQQRTFLFYTLMQDPSRGHNLPGQGLKKKTPEEEKEEESKSIVLHHINKRIEEQKASREQFPVLPDYKFHFHWFVCICGVVVVGVLIFSDIKTLIFGLQEEPSKNDCVKPDKTASPLVALYTFLPLRFFSRIWGRLMEMKLNNFARKSAIGLFCWMTGANIDEALEKDLTAYESMGSFFSRAIDPQLRPINQTAPVVSPSDGKVLTFGTVTDGQIEQVKGITYSLRKFLGPIPQANVQKNSQENYIKDMNLAPLGDYQTAIMKEPEKNSLFQCVIYLSPGDYHRFHSPCEWVVKYRRHFPGELLSVNPKIASWLKDLFVLNERVVLSGTWKHGFFSMTAVGATAVGSIKVYEDILLKTNQIKWKYGTFYDFEFGDEGIHLNKADPVGEFNLGSTVVLVFEAPRDFEFKLDEDQNLKYGEKLIFSSQQ